MRTKEQVQEAIRQNKIELDRLAEELIDVTAEVFLAVYDVRDNANSKVIALPPQEWVSGKILGIECYFEKYGRVVRCTYGDDADRSEDAWFARNATMHLVTVDGVTDTRFDDCVSLRAFTSRNQAEACLALWVRTAGTSEYEQ